MVIKIGQDRNLAHVLHTMQYMCIFIDLIAGCGQENKDRNYSIGTKVGCRILQFKKIRLFSE